MRSLSYKGINPIMGVPPSCPHLNLCPKGPTSKYHNGGEEFNANLGEYKHSAHDRTLAENTELG